MAAGGRNGRVVFFDLDGVLIDSRPSIAKSLNATLAAHGYRALREEEVDASIGPPILTTFRDLLPSLGGDGRTAETCVTTFREIYAELGPRETPLMPGIAALLDDLARSYPLVVATSKAQYLAEAILTTLGIADRFAHIVGPARHALTEGKSATLGRAIAQIGTGRPGTMIGDRKYDISAGKDHACRTIGVTWGSGSYQELRDAGADAIVDHPNELAATIDG